MAEERSPDPHVPPEDVENPTSEELDVEGPNESATGHQPSGEEADREHGSDAGSEPQTS
jgi:hypothetical protein